MDALNTLREIIAMTGSALRNAQEYIRNNIVSAAGSNDPGEAEENAGENVVPGDVVSFGRYWQEDSEVKTPVEWQVLDVKEKEALLISRYVLDCRQYHHERCSVTWAECDLRKWLNREFFREAFSEEERKRIAVSHLKNESNPEFRTSGGTDTDDRIFCLSIRESVQYFRNNAERRCQPTLRAISQKAFIGKGFCYWWLRSPGDYHNDAVRISASGAVELSGYRVSNYTSTVRPALRVIL